MTAVEYPVELDLTVPERKMLMHSFNRPLVLVEAMLAKPGNTMDRAFWLHRLETIRNRVHNHAHPITVLCEYDADLLAQCYEGNELLRDLGVQAMGNPSGMHSQIMAYGRASKTLRQKLGAALGRVLTKRL